MKKNKKIKVIFILILLLTLALTYGVSFAKYAYSNVLNYYYKSKEFYFSSSYLDINLVSNVNNNWKGNNVYFDIKNYLNDSLITEYDISYSVSCSTNNSNYKCNINNSGKDEYDGILSSSKVCINNENIVSDINNIDDCTKNGYQWQSSGANSELYFNVSSSDNSIIDDVVVNITVTSKMPYKKSLKGEFVLYRASNIGDDVVLNTKNYDDYVEVVVSNLLDEKKSYSLEFDSDLLRVDTNSDIKSESIKNNFINKISFEIDANSNKKIIFYKTSNSDNISKDNFELIVN